jgi:transmembrane sensor
MDELPKNISPEMILAYLENQISEEEFTIVQSWIDASPDNRHQLEQFRMVWEETGLLIPAPVDVDIDLAWDKMSLKINDFEENTSSPKEKTGRIIPFRKYILRVAAVLIPLISLAVIYLLLLQKPEIITKETTAQSIKDTLSDGSIISLNENSTIKYPKKFKGSTREVEMKGEAFFEIKHDSTKPFIIHAENAMIKVLGTSFNIKAYVDSAQIEVSVKTGRVRFSVSGQELNEKDSVILIAGETGIYDKSTKKIWKADLPVKQELQQEDKILIFNRTSLLKVAEEIQKKYGVTIVLKNKDFENVHYSATFKNSSIDSIIQVMSNTLDLKVIKQGSKYIFEENEQ